ncbi:MAG: hypothetical protein KY475_22605 [Planctomycetes bacterium]|nr:hypothetical protein [Planctomycetota bacterium]
MTTLLLLTFPLMTPLLGAFQSVIRNDANADAANAFLIGHAFWLLFSCVGGLSAGLLIAAVFATVLQRHPHRIRGAALGGILGSVAPPLLAFCVVALPEMFANDFGSRPPTTPPVLLWGAAVVLSVLGAICGISLGLVLPNATEQRATRMS